MKKHRYELVAGRGVLIDGKHAFSIVRTGCYTGEPISPVDLDTLTRRIVTLLNSQPDPEELTEFERGKILGKMIGWQQGQAAISESLERGFPHEDDGEPETDTKKEAVHAD